MRYFVIRRGAGGIFCLLLAVGLLMGLGTSRAGDLPESFADLAAKVSPSVVNIRTVKTIKTGGGGIWRFHGRPGGQQGEEGMPDLHEFFRRFFGGPGGPGLPDMPHQFKQRALGSGVIIDSEGLVLTNNHVVAGADEIQVKLKGGKVLKAKIIGRDKKTDLALIKVDTDDDLPVLEMGDSERIRVGDWVLAIGNPFGLENTVTAGIISAKGRFIGAGPYDDFLQTDASINPGNSGGALVNMDGELVGINTAIVAQGQGIGFAIPINLAKNIVAQLKERGRVVRGWLGVYIQPLTEELASKFGLKQTEGALVADVIKGSPAQKAGIKRGDVIVAFNGRKVTDTHTLPRLVAGTKVGSRAEVKVLRGGKEISLSVTIGELKEEASGAPAPFASPQRLGMSLQELTPELAQQLGMPGKKGLVVTAVKPGGPAAEAGLKRGDVILEAAQKKVTTVKQFNRLVAGLKAGEGLLLLIQRGDASLFVVVKAPK